MFIILHSSFWDFVNGVNLCEVEENVSMFQTKMTRPNFEASKVGPQSLYLGKTESILFGSCIRKKLSKWNRLNTNCNNKKIESKSNIKYLEVTFDECFSGLSIASFMLKKINAKLIFLYRNNM